jgi:hypothetical protein
MAGRPGERPDKEREKDAARRADKEHDLVRDERGQTQPETKEDAQRTSGDVRPAKSDN